MKYEHASAPKSSLSLAVCGRAAIAQDACAQSFHISRPVPAYSAPSSHCFELFLQPHEASSSPPLNHPNFIDSIFPEACDDYQHPSLRRLPRKEIDTALGAIQTAGKMAAPRGTSGTGVGGSRCDLQHTSLVFSEPCSPGLRFSGARKPAGDTVGLRAVTQNLSCSIARCVMPFRTPRLTRGKATRAAASHVAEPNLQRSFQCECCTYGVLICESPARRVLCICAPLPRCPLHWRPSARLWTVLEPRTSFVSICALVHSDSVSTSLGPDVTTLATARLVSSIESKLGC